MGLTPEEKQEMRRRLLEKYHAAQDDTSVQEARDSADTTDLISGIGMALSKAANANAMSRGGQAPDLSVFKDMSSQARQAIKDAVEARQGKIAAAKGEIDLQQGFNAEDRADAGLQLSKDQFANTKEQQGIQNKLTQDKMAQDASQFDQTMAFNKQKNAQDVGFKQQELGQKERELGYREDEKKRAFDAKQQELNEKKTKEIEELTVPGYGIARTSQEARDFRTEIADTTTAIQLLKDVKTLGKDVNLLDRTRINKIDGLLNDAVGKMRLSLVGPGPMTEAERAIVRETIGDPTKLFSTEGIQSAKLDQLISNAQRALERKAAQVIKTPETSTAPDDTAARRQRLEELRKKKAMQ